MCSHEKSKKDGKSTPKPVTIQRIIQEQLCRDDEKVHRQQKTMGMMLAKFKETKHHSKTSGNGQRKYPSGDTHNSTKAHTFVQLHSEMREKFTKLQQCQSDMCDERQRCGLYLQLNRNKQAELRILRQIEALESKHGKVHKQTYREEEYTAEHIAFGHICNDPGFQVHLGDPDFLWLINEYPETPLRLLDDSRVEQYRDMAMDVFNREFTRLTSMR